MGCQLVNSQTRCTNNTLTTEVAMAATVEILNRLNRAVGEWVVRQTMDITTIITITRPSSNMSRVKLDTISIHITLGLDLPELLMQADKERMSVKIRLHLHLIDFSISRTRTLPKKRAVAQPSLRRASISYDSKRNSEESRKHEHQKILHQNGRRRLPATRMVATLHDFFCYCSLLVLLML